MKRNTETEKKREKQLTIGRENLIKETILEQGNREIHYNTK